MGLVTSSSSEMSTRNVALYTIFNAATMITAYLLGFYIISTFSLGIAFSPSFSANRVGITINRFKDYHSTTKTQMGKYDSCTAHIGIKISLSDLISQINEKNFELIKNMLKEGFIEDEQEEINKTYQELFEESLSDDALKCKKLLLDSLENEPFFHEPFLIPVKKLLEVYRIGRDLYGTNGVSRPVDFGLSLSTEETER